MQRLQILEHTSNSLLLLLIFGTFLSLIIVYFLFAQGWQMALLGFIAIDLILMAAHKYMSNSEPKILEINHHGIVTNGPTIKYSEIREVKHEFRQVIEDQVTTDMNCLVVLTPDNAYSFKVDSYKNSSHEILSCIKNNIKHSQSK